MMYRRWLLGTTLATALAVATPGLADDHTKASASASAPAVPSGPLPELPKLTPLTHTEPDAASLKELDQLLERLVSGDERTRAAAQAALGEVSASIVPAIRHRIQDIRGSLDREAAPRILEDARKAGRKSLKKGDKPDKKSRDKDKTTDDEDGDWLDFMLASARPKEAPWRDVTKLLAMVRLLSTIGTTPAVREMIALHAQFGDLLRIDLQRQVHKLKDKAVPALIEARQHDAKVVQRWANRMLDQLGKAIPGEAVSTGDAVVLADVLRAYGRTRDVDAARVVLSFANSERVQLRQAAREAIAAIGEPGLWQLRDAYLGLTGEKPPKDWAWDRVAREIFGLYDRGRLVEVHKLMEDGLGAEAAGKHGDAIAAFDRVLARVPLFERRREMVPAYLGRAKELEKDQADESLALLRKALRLDPKSTGARKIEADIAYLEGMALLAQGKPDKFVFAKALELDPSHEGAKAALASLEDKATARQQSYGRYGAAAAIGVVAVALVLLLSRRKKPAPTPPAPTPAPPSAPPGPEES